MLNRRQTSGAGLAIAEVLLFVRMGIGMLQDYDDVDLDGGVEPTPMVEPTAPTGPAQPSLQDLRPGHEADGSLSRSELDAMGREAPPDLGMGPAVALAVAAGASILMGSAAMYLLFFPAPAPEDD